MVKVNIPFQEKWQEKMVYNIKTCTSRTKKYGNPGDTFVIFGALFKILKVERLTLTWVANNLYKEEGCDNPEEFGHIWISLHPRAGWRPSQVVFTHHFERILK